MTIWVYCGLHYFEKKYYDVEVSCARCHKEFICGERLMAEDNGCRKLKGCVKLFGSELYTNFHEYYVVLFKFDPTFGESHNCCHHAGSSLSNPIELVKTGNGGGGWSSRLNMSTVSSISHEWLSDIRGTR